MNGAWDVLIVGAGPAGMAAAVRASESGAQAAVIDDNPGAGGQIWRGGGGRWRDALRRRNVPVFTGCSVFDAHPETHSVVVESAEGAFQARYQKIVLATGSREIFLPFPGWTLPGVTGAGGLQALAKGGLPVDGKRVVVGGSGPLLLAVAAYLRQRGADVRYVAEQAPWKAVAGFLARTSSAGKLWQAAQLRMRLGATPYLTSAWVTAAEGEGRVRRVHIASARGTTAIDCDYAAVGYGLHPNTELAALFGCRIGDAGVEVDTMQRTSVPDVYSAGECTGIGGVELSLTEGQIAGYAAAGNVAGADGLMRGRDRGRRFGAALQAAFALRPEVLRLARSDTILCRCEDVPMGRASAFPDFQTAKMQTRLGMGPCQGRVCGVAARHLFGWGSASIRPPVFPASIAALALDGSDDLQEAQIDK